MLSLENKKRSNCPKWVRTFLYIVGSVLELAIARPPNERLSSLTRAHQRSKSSSKKIAESQFKHWADDMYVFYVWFINLKFFSIFFLSNEMYLY
jgi:hypothetical protein